jgi:ABC-type amino acid transport substrate-binding protein
MVRRSVRRWGAVFAIAALAAWPVPGADAEAGPSATPTVELRVGVPHLPPWAFHDADCRLTGIAVENLRRLAERAGRRFVAVPLPLDAGADARKAGDVALFLGDPKLSTGLEDTLELPFGHTIDRIAVYQGPWATASTVPPSTLKVGARTVRLAESLGFAESQIVAGEVNGALADALAAGRLDVLVGGREVVYVALMRRGWGARTLRSHTRRLGSYELHYRLTPNAEPMHGNALRRALAGFDWPLRDRQLRQRFLSPDVAREPMLTPECQRQGRAN